MKVKYISNTIYKKWFETMSEQLESTITGLKDIIEFRDRCKACEILGMDEVQYFIDDICIN